MIVPFSYSSLQIEGCLIWGNHEKQSYAARFSEWHAGSDWYIAVDALGGIIRGGPGKVRAGA